MTLLVVVACAVAVLAAVRSTWSPCGLSMLSTITPLGELSRGNRYPVTVAWFLLGSVVGGATLGVGLAVGALGVGALGLSTTTLLVLAAGCAFVALGSDLGIGGLHIPGTHRQVDEVWLTTYRPWVYALGFGWQIGVGLATYLTTAAVYLTCALAVLTGVPALAFAIGVGFGAIRGLSLLSGARLTSPQRLRDFHARMAELDPLAARLTAWAIGGCLVVLASALAPAAGAVALVVSVALLVRFRGLVSRTVLP